MIFRLMTNWLVKTCRVARVIYDRKYGAAAILVLII